jgi:sugar phosphate isomerase/epimerase
MGTGDLDYQTFFRGLKDGGYTGPVTYEMCSPLHGGGSLDNLDRYARVFLDYVSRVWLKKEEDWKTGSLEAGHIF